MAELKTITTKAGTYDSFPDKTAREELASKVSTPESPIVGYYLRIKAVNEDGTISVESVPAPTASGAELPNAAKFETLAIGASGTNGVYMQRDGTDEAPTLDLYGEHGDERVRLRNLAEAVDDSDAPTLAQVREMVALDSGENLTLDTTLTQSGKAADAKATGDALKNLDVSAAVESYFARNPVDGGIAWATPELNEPWRIVDSSGEVVGPEEGGSGEDGVTYISDGLEFRLDGIQNTMAGHSTADYKQWVDVSGNGYTTVAHDAASGQILDACYTSILSNGNKSRCQRMVVERTEILPKLGEFTFEVVWKPFESLSANLSLVRVGNGPANHLISCAGQTHVLGNNTAHGTAVTEVEGMKHWSVTYDGTNLVLYHEAEQDVSVPASIDITACADLEFWGDSAWAQAAQGYFYAARIYTRALSAEEIKANYNADISRFGAE